MVGRRWSDVGGCAEEQPAEAFEARVRFQQGRRYQELAVEGSSKSKRGSCCFRRKSKRETFTEVWSQAAGRETNGCELEAKRSDGKRSQHSLETRCPIVSAGTRAVHRPSRRRLERGSELKLHRRT